jgi:hypothetical protein
MFRLGRGAFRRVLLQTRTPPECLSKGRSGGVSGTLKGLASLGRAPLWQFNGAPEVPRRSSPNARPAESNETQQRSVGLKNAPPSRAGQVPLERLHGKRKRLRRKSQRDTGRDATRLGSRPAPASSRCPLTPRHCCRADSQCDQSAMRAARRRAAFPRGSGCHRRQ